MLELPSNVEDLKKLVRSIGYKENIGGGLDYYNTGYHAWYAPPDYDKIIEDLEKRDTSWVKTDDDVKEIIHDELYEWYLNSRG